MLDEALRYRNMNLSIIPVGKDKRPLIPWKEFQERHATLEEITDWFTRPDTNIGIVTGKISGITVLDCDSQDAINKFRAMYTGLTASVRTPRGMHFYYKYEEGVRNTVKVGNLDMDVRGEGGYVLAPPSVNDKGQQYSWQSSLSSLNALDSFSSILNIYNARARGTNSQHLSTMSTDVNTFFRQGRRDEDLFHVANCLIKGGAKPDIIPQVLEILAQNCNPPFPEKEITAKIKSAIDRADRKERNLAAEVEEFVMSTFGVFMSTDVNKNLGVVNRCQQQNVSTILRRLCDKGIIERYGTRNGCFRRVEKEYDVIELDGKIPDPLKIHYPMGIGNLCHVYEGMTTLLEGEKSRGKSAFGIEFAWLNRNLFKQKIRYMQNGELNKQTLTIRLSLRPQDQYPIKAFTDKIEFINRHREWWDIVNPTGLNIIDYIEEHEKKYLIPQYIAKIQERLTTGHALIILQRVPGRDYGTGGAEIRNKPSVILSLQKSGGMSKVVVEDIKAYNIETMQKLTGDTLSPRGLWREYKLVNGWKFVPQGRGWRSWDDKKEYDQFRSEDDDVFVHED